MRDCKSRQSWATAPRRRSTCSNCNISCRGLRATCCSNNANSPRCSRRDRRLCSIRTNASIVWRCGSCRRESSAKFDPCPPQPYIVENRQFAPLLVVECRGLEFVGFDPRGFWQCVGSTGALFSEVDLTDGEWTDYDEKAKLPVEISAFESQWTRACS